MPTLLEKAMRHPSSKKSIPVSEEELELLKAALNGEISFDQVTSAYGMTSRGAATYKLMNLVIRAYKQGILSFR